MRVLPSLDNAIKTSPSTEAHEKSPLEASIFRGEGGRHMRSRSLLRQVPREAAQGRGEERGSGVAGWRSWGLGLTGAGGGGERRAWAWKGGRDGNSG